MAIVRLSVLVYVGLLFIAMAAACLTHPQIFAAPNGHRMGASLLTLGLCVFVVSMVWRAREVIVVQERSRLDHYVPRYQFYEIHSIRVGAERERVYEAVRAVTAGEIPLFRTLTWIRRFGRAAPEGILNPPPGEPILDVALRTTFRILAEDPGREIVVGTVVIAPRGWRPPATFDPDEFRNARSPGFALAAMNFRIEEAGPNRSVVTTETRVFATDPTSRRKFARYWRIIYPGSSFIRRMWLRAIRRRIEHPLPA